MSVETLLSKARRDYYMAMLDKVARGDLLAYYKEDGRIFFFQNMPHLIGIANKKKVRISADINTLALELGITEEETL